MNIPPALRAFVEDIAAIKATVADMARASQGERRSVEGGAIDVYTDDDELVARIGEQTDGSVGLRLFGGPEPAAPTSPDVTFIDGGALVAWDGRFEEYQPQLAVDRVAVHVDETAGFTPTRDTEVAAIYSGYGGTAVVPIDAGATWYVKLVAVSSSGVESDPSDEVMIGEVDTPDIAFWQDTFTLASDGAQLLQLSFEPIANSEHLYCNGRYQREDVSWTVDRTFVQLLATGRAPRTGDVVTVEYAYLEPDDDAVPALAQALLNYDPTWDYDLQDPTNNLDVTGHGHDTDYGSTTQTTGLLNGDDAPGIGRHFAGGNFAPESTGYVPRLWSSLVAIVKPGSGQAGDGTILGSMSTILAAHTFFVGVDSGGHAIVQCYGSGSLRLGGSIDLRGSKHMIAATFDHTTFDVRLYVDGALVAKGNNGGELTAGSGLIYAGDGNGRVYLGDLGRLTFWANGVVLTEADALDLYRAWQVGN